MILRVSHKKMRARHTISCIKLGAVQNIFSLVIIVSQGISYKRKGTRISP